MEIVMNDPKKLEGARKNQKFFTILFSFLIINDLWRIYMAYSDLPRREDDLERYIFLLVGYILLLIFNLKFRKDVK